MHIWLINLWDRFQSSFWFIPTVMAVLAIVLGFVMPEVDTRVNVAEIDYLNWLGTTKAAARSMLGALAGAMITVAGVVFSMTMIVLSITASQFGSRLLRAFMQDRVTQFGLGAFLATSIYCLLVMKDVHSFGDGDTFVPHISVFLAVVLSILNLVAFIYFLHHMSVSMQAQTIVGDVADDLERSIERLFPQRVGDAPPDDNGANTRELADCLGRKHVSVAVEKEGYLQAIDGDALLGIAVEVDRVFELMYRPGDFLIQGLPLLRIRPPIEVDDELRERLKNCYIVGSQRTPRQDVECAINELVEVAVRALSPGINDPFTAMTCIDRLSASMGRLAARDFPSRYRYDDKGEFRMIVPPTTFTGALNAAFDQIRQNGRKTTSVSIRLLEGLARIAPFTTRDADRRAILRQAEMIVSGSKSGLPEKHDREEVRERYEALVELLGQAADVDEPHEVDPSALPGAHVARV